MPQRERFTVVEEDGKFFAEYGCGGDELPSGEFIAFRVPVEDATNALWATLDDRAFWSPTPARRTR